jgi:hypothetical protein
MTENTIYIPDRHNLVSLPFASYASLNMEFSLAYTLAMNKDLVRLSTTIERFSRRDMGTH